MHANWWHQRKSSSSGKVMWFALRWPKAASVWRSYLLSLISVAFPADRERCIRRQKGARWGEGSVLVCKNGGVRHTNRPKASGKTDDFGTSSCIVCYSVTGHKWPENKILVRPMSATPSPTWSWTPHTEQTNISDLCSEEDTGIPLIQQTFLNARTPPLPKNTWKHPPHKTFMCLFRFCFITAWRKKNKPVW